MSDEKLRLTTYLEFASGALPGAFTAQTLGEVPNVVDDEDDDPDDFLRMKVDVLQDDEPQKEKDDEELFKVIKSFLGHDDHDWEQQPDEHLDDESVNHQDEVEGKKKDQEAHSQLIAAINDLRDEIKNMRTGKSQPQQDVGDPEMLVGHEENEESYEEDEQENTKQARARQMFTSLVNQGMPRQDIIDQFIKQIGVTNSTATSYYQRLAKEAGLTTSGDREMPGKEPSGLGVASGTNPSTMNTVGYNDQEGDPNQEGDPTEQPETNVTGVEVEGDPNRQGLIRTVKGAHLVYKRKNEEGTYDELWNFGTGGDLKSALQVRRAILAGTDIPPRSLKSENGQQSYTLTTLGNGQILHIKGLPN